MLPTTAARRCVAPSPSRSWLSSSALSRSPTLALPSRHSRQVLPPVCTDAVQLTEWTQQVMEAPVGSLFGYATTTAAHANNNSRTAAWETADDTAQKVEFLVRGYAAQLPGTLWQRWLPPSAQPETSAAVDSADAALCLQAMEGLVDRIWDEGHAYMVVRADRLRETTERLATTEASSETPPQLASGDNSESNPNDSHRPPSWESYSYESFASSAAGAVEGIIEHDVEDETTAANELFMNDFSLPGPTVHMFHTLLDAMACSAEHNSAVTMEQTRLLWTDLRARHAVDGGDLANTQPQTALSVLSYNAPLRIAASLPYVEHDVTARDQGLLLAMEAYDALVQSKSCLRNSATFCYVLQAVAKYMPASRNRGNVVEGFFAVAQEEGCVDESVLAAYALAQTPSNGPEFEDCQIFDQDAALGDLPHSWRRHNKARRFHPREATY